MPQPPKSKLPVSAVAPYIMYSVSLVIGLNLKLGPSILHLANTNTNIIINNISFTRSRKEI